jgi:hypothetical protein
MLASLITAVNVLTAGVLSDRGLISAETVLLIGSVRVIHIREYAAARTSQASYNWWMRRLACSV